MSAMGQHGDEMMYNFLLYSKTVLSSGVHNDLLYIEHANDDIKYVS